MKYILSKNIALRSWQLVPYAYYVKWNRNAYELRSYEYEFLKECDGKHECTNPNLAKQFLKCNFIKPVEANDELSFWQKEKICDNRYFPAMNFMITGKCNYNCLHCFNASDNNKLQSEFTFEEAVKLIEEAEKCGINTFTITGGEPMIHPRFIDIIRTIYSHNMYVEELNTNGCFLTKEILDELKKIKCFPIIKISFDGLGHHDWLRNKKSAEEDAVRAIKICIDNGFKVKVQTNVHRKNIESMFDTAKFLNSIGVYEMRIIRTTESPRWLQNGRDACLTFNEYFDRMILFLNEYIKINPKMNIDIWQLAYVWPHNKKYKARAIECNEDEYCDTIPVCRGNRGMVAVGANGNLYPCHQISGYYEQHNWILGNVKTDGLQKCLKDSEYLKTVCTTVKDLKEHNEKCATCKWFKYCCGGCRAIGLLLTNDIFGYDKSKCLFFNNNYIEKLSKALPEYENISPIF